MSQTVRETLHADAPSAVRFDHHDPGRPILGLGSATPRLSWQIATAEPGFRQGAYQLEVLRGDARPELVTVESSDQVLVPWPVSPLTSRERVIVRVRVRPANADGAGPVNRVERANDRRGRPALAGRLDRAVRESAEHR